ncbi:MAG: GspE/PulE family protein [bacterium]|nr:GspE/PulE family protein [bacterium]
MTDFPSIAELKPENGSGETTSAPAKFRQTIKNIKLDELEKQTEANAKQSNLPYINLQKFPISAEALRVVPEELAKTKNLVCFAFLSEEIRLGTTIFTKEIEELAYQFGERHHANAIIYLISDASLERALKLYSTLPIVLPVSKDINITDAELNKYQTGLDNLQALAQLFTDISITDILTLMIASALKLDSSDIHVEAEEKGIAVRYRVDGVLHDIATLPKEQWKKFVSRIKLLAALKINVTDRPQDGRVTLKLTSGSLDIRVSTLPTVHGESVVMRILHSGSKGVTFDELGIRGAAYVRLKQEMERPNGMIITTGPTGSGKTTTLYSILQLLNKPGVKVITLEDPVEIKMEGVNQSQVDPSHNYTFAKGLRSILRQDPDICMVGEIRDLETADIAIQAALTGHLMLSTIHTNSASGAIPRFLSMGVKPFFLAPALNSVIAQRLVRRLCPACVVEAELESDVLEHVGQVLKNLPDTERTHIKLNDLHFYKGTGCTQCSGLGYKGRVGIYEIFTMNKELEKIILSEQVSEYAIQELAVKNGMVTMVQDGLLKALDKITTVEEIFRVTE